jgi:VWFA-related protein
MCKVVGARIVRCAVGVVVFLMLVAPDLRARQNPPVAQATVDVEVVDADGQPIANLTPDMLQVEVGGRARPIVSAQFLPGASDAPRNAAPANAEARVLVLAIDAASFSADESLGVSVAAQGLVDRLPRTDPVGVYVYPSGTRLEPTTDRRVVRSALAALASQPAAGASPFARTLGALDDILPRLGSVPGRKVVVLVSAASTDGAGSPPPALTESPVRATQQAAASHAVIYTLFVGRGFLEMTIPHKLGEARAAPRREDTAVANWLGELSARAGGMLVEIAGPNPDPAFGRILGETDAIYRITIASAAEDRDGRLRSLGVKTTRAQANVRAPSWLVMPGGDEAPGPEVAAASPPPAAESDATLDAIVRAYERGEFASVRASLAQTPDLARWIRGFRTARPPWPDTPRRAAVLSLEVAAVALATDQPSAVSEATMLLLQQSAGVRAPGDADGFECSWFWAGLTLFEGGQADAGESFAKAARLRCPRAPRVVLAAAVLADQRAPVIFPAIRIGPAAAAEAAAHQAVIDRYEFARSLPGVEFEARIREAWLLYRLRKFDAAVALTENLEPPADLGGGLGGDVDLARQMRYVSHFVRAQVLREQRDFDRAIVAYREAIAAWPDGQSARVALMTLLATQGHREEAAALAKAVESTPKTAIDPWWLFWEGDRLLFPALVAKLREALP